MTLIIRDEKQIEAIRKAGAECWQEIDSGYLFSPDSTLHATITPSSEGWYFQLKVNGKVHSGNRKTLEEAFKTIDLLIYENARDWWGRMKCSVVLTPWAYSLPELER